MKYFQIIIVSLFVFFGCNNTYNEKSDMIEVSKIGNNYDAKIISKYVLSKTVSITMQDKHKQPVSYGYGVIFDTSLVITNRHVIENATYGFVEIDNKKHKIEGYVAIDKINDLVILKIPSLVKEGIKQFHGELATGEKVYVAGNPQGLSETVTTGIVSNPNRKFEKIDLIQISAPISPGSSGGPVVNEAGELIGVAVGALTKGQNLNFAVPIKHIEKLKQQITKVNSLNIKTIKGKLDDIINTNPHEWIVLRRFDYSRRRYSKFNDRLIGFSILNNTEWPISSILVLLISYDDSGIPVDYQIHNFFINNPILPGLAKTVASKLYIKRACKNCKIEYRILNYTLHNE